MAEGKTELRSQLEEARMRLERAGAELARDLDVGSHLRESFAKNKAAYISGAGVLGLLLAKLPGRRKEAKTGKLKEAEKAIGKAGVWLLLLQVLLKGMSPTLTAAVSKGVTEFVKSRGRKAG